MGFLVGTTIASTVWLMIVVCAAAALALPLGWLWMLLDALLREEYYYPGATPGSNNRLLWVLLILFVHVTAIAYFLMVYRPARRYGVPATPAVA